jgi:large repetitive protein
VIDFDHRFGFEDGGVAPFFDGGMIEISRNGGPWEDISTFIEPGYGGTLFVGSGNPLGGRRAFVSRSASFPARDHLTLNLGTAFAGQTVRIRFRIGTDAAAADFGWEIDNIAFQGITNLPFSQYIADLSECRGVPKKDKVSGRCGRSARGATDKNRGTSRPAAPAGTVVHSDASAVPVVTAPGHERRGDHESQNESA